MRVVRVSVIAPLRDFGAVAPDSDPRQVIQSQLKVLSPLKPTLQGVHRQAEGHRRLLHAAEMHDGQLRFPREVLHHHGFVLDVPSRAWTCTRTHDWQALWKQGLATDTSGCTCSVWPILAILLHTITRPSCEGLLVLDAPC